MDFFNAAGVKLNAASWVFFSAPSSPVASKEKGVEGHPATLSFETPSDSAETTSSTISKMPDESPKDITPGVNADSAISGNGKGKKKNKKKKQSSSDQTKSSGAKSGGVKWGDVEQIYFSREIAYSSVPNRGAYPLGLGEETKRTTSTIDELFVQQQMDLLERARSLNIPIPTEAPKPSQISPKPCSGSVVPPPQASPKSPKRKGKRPSVPAVTVDTSANSNPITESNTEAIPPVSPNSGQYMSPLFETRQFDYKQGRNGMFRPIAEDDRILALMTNKTEWNKLTDTSKSHSKQHKDQPQHLAEMIKDTKEIQNSRESSSSGCSCKPIKVDKLSVSKLKSELVASGQYELQEIDNWSKVTLTAKLKVVVSDCELCTTNGCVCVQMGIACSAQSQCGCLRAVAGTERRQRSNTADSIELDSSVVLCEDSAVQRDTRLSSVDSSSGTDSDRERSNSSIKKRVPCGNVNGYELFDMMSVMDYRREVLGRIPPIASTIA